MQCNVILCKSRFHIIIQLALVNVKLHLIHCYNGIRKKQREEIYVISTQVCDPAYIIKSCDDMHISAGFFHSLANTSKFAFCALTGVFFAKSKCRFFRKCRTVCPHLIYQIFRIVDLTIFSCNGCF